MYRGHSSKFIYHVEADTHATVTARRRIMELKNMNGFCELTREDAKEIDGGNRSRYGGRGTFCGGYAKNLSARDFCQTAAYFGGTMAAALAVSNPAGAAAWAFIAATSAYAGR